MKSDMLNGVGTNEGIASRKLSSDEARKRFLASQQGKQAISQHAQVVQGRAAIDARALAASMRPEKPLVRR